jgi:chromosome segregation ATPase
VSDTRLARLRWAHHNSVSSRLEAAHLAAEDARLEAEQARLEALRRDSTELTRRLEAVRTQYEADSAALAAVEAEISALPADAPDVDFAALCDGDPELSAILRRIPELERGIRNRDAQIQELNGTIAALEAERRELPDQVNVLASRVRRQEAQHLAAVAGASRTAHRFVAHIAALGRFLNALPGDARFWATLEEVAPEDREPDLIAEYEKVVRGLGDRVDRYAQLQPRTPP